MRSGCCVFIVAWSPRYGFAAGVGFAAVAMPAVAVPHCESGFAPRAGSAPADFNVSSLLRHGFATGVGFAGSGYAQTANKNHSNINWPFSTASPPDVRRWLCPAVPLLNLNRALPLVRALPYATPLTRRQ